MVVWSLRIGGWWFVRYILVGSGLVVTHCWVVVWPLRIGGWWFGHYALVGGGFVVTHWWMVVWSLRLGGWWFDRYALVDGGFVVTYWWVVVWSLRIGGWWFGRPTFCGTSKSQQQWRHLNSEMDINSYLRNCAFQNQAAWWGPLLIGG